MQLVIGAGRTAAIQSRFRPVTTATTPSAQAVGQQGAAAGWPGR